MTNENFDEKLSSSEDGTRTKTQIQSKIQCQICLRTFSGTRHLVRHTRSVHENVKPFNCELCSAKFGRKDGLVRHVKATHGALKPFGCKLCQVRFARSDALKIHVRLFIKK
jgi:uncharacterized Zn-finger protein